MAELGRIAASAALTAIITGLVQSLVPEGRTRKIAALCGGILMMLVLLRPLSGISADTAVFGADGLSDEARDEILLSGLEITKQIIEERTGAYILNKSDKLGLLCSVEVTCAGDGFYPVPWSVVIRCKAPEHARNALGGMLEDDLGIPPSRQRYELSGEG